MNDKAKALEFLAKLKALCGEYDVRLGGGMGTFQVTNAFDCLEVDADGVSWWFSSESGQWEVLNG